jgi:hypothetical protein
MLLNLYSQEMLIKPIKWKKWQGVQMKGKNGATLNKKGLIEKEGSGEQLIADLTDQLIPWAYHTFLAKWQYRQFKALKENLPVHTLLTVADFSENYRCSYQDEISAAYYMYSQVTLHPIQCYYRSGMDDEDELVEEAVVYLSDDLVHDHAAVTAFNEHLYKHIEKTRHVSIEKHVQFSDGCAAQYKGKQTFHAVGQMTLLTERCFFGSRHGKGPCDSLGGVVKNCATRFVKSRKGIISSAEDMFKFATENLVIDEDYNKRVFFLISADELEQRRHNIKDKGKTVPDTREIHAVKNSPNGLLKRFVACYCRPCIDERYEECENKEHVDPWKPAEKKTIMQKTWKLPTKKAKQKKEEESVVASQNRGGEKTDEVQPTKKRKIIETPEVREERAKLRRSIRLFAARKPEPEMKVQKMAQKRASSAPVKGEEKDEDKKKSKSLFSVERRQASLKHKQAGSQKVNRRLELPVKSRVEMPVKSRVEMPVKSSTDSKNMESEIMSDRTVKKLLRAMIHSPFHIQATTASSIEFKDVEMEKDLSLVHLKATVDDTALELMPEDLPSHVRTEGQPHFPIVVEGDGNCLCRVGSVLMYGTEDHHLEVRLRIAVEMILFRDIYLDEEHLSKGLPDTQRLTPAMVAQFSDRYVMQHLDANSVQTIYLQEVHQVLKPAEFMGTWQLFALASVLKHPIFSAYPQLGNPSVRRDLHRVIMPREEADSRTKLPVILWSSCRGDMKSEHWIPNHFTVVLPVLM